MNRQEFKHNQLFAGEVNYITKVKVANGTYKRGDVLENVVTAGPPDSLAATWVKAKTDAKLENNYVVCAEDVVISKGNEEIVVYKEGVFNAEVIKINDTKATEKSIEILKTKNIFIENVIKA